MGKASFWNTYECDRCSRLDHSVAPKQLPKGWESHHYTGETLCSECAEKDGKP